MNEVYHFHFSILAPLFWVLLFILVMLIGYTIGVTRLGMRYERELRKFDKEVNRLKKIINSTPLHERQKK